MKFALEALKVGRTEVSRGTNDLGLGPVQTYLDAALPGQVAGCKLLILNMFQQGCWETLRNPPKNAVENPLVGSESARAS
jgi:hypothetical protein